ncbi:transcription termination factor 4, mitochondrial [Tanacetum coccineum]
MMQFPSSTKMIPTLFLLTPQWSQPHKDELLLAMRSLISKIMLCLFCESEKCNEIRKIDSNQIVIGKTTIEEDKEDFDNDADDDDADNAESSGDEFEQENGDDSCAG